MPSTSSVKFDYAGAKAAGFTDEQIAKSLAAKRAQGINVYLDRNEVAATRSGAPPPEAGPQLVATPGLGARLRNRAVAGLPAAGGFVGGIAGGAVGAGVGGAGAVPGAIAGAGLGGATGYALQRRLSGNPISARDMALQGGEQAAYQALGEGLAFGAGKAARPIMRRALGVGKAVLGGPGDVAETAIANRLLATKGGAMKADALRSAPASELFKVLEAARNSGVRLNTRAVAADAKALLLDKAIPVDQKARIATELTAFMKQYGATMDPVLLKQVKQYRQEVSRSLYKAGLSPGGEAAQGPRLFSKRIAEGARRQLETIPGVAEREAETQRMLLAQKALKKAVERPPRAIALEKPGTWPSFGLNSPAFGSWLAIRLADPRFHRALRQSPRAAAEVMRQMMQEDAPDSTSGY